MNSIAREPLKGSEQKLTQILTIVRRRTDDVFEVMGSKVKVTEMFAGGGIQIDRSPSKAILFLFRCYITD